MPSPFPGMDPHLEHPSYWHGFHVHLIGEMTRRLVHQVQPRFWAATEEMLFIHEASAEERRAWRRQADSSIALKPPWSGALASTGRDAGAADIVVPVSAVLPEAVDIEKHRYITILDEDSRRIVTVIELLSPTNKRPGADREQYLAKRKELLRSQAHVVEIDLLRGGPRMPMEPGVATPYCVMVSRQEERPRVGVWPVALRDALPTIPIPLLEGDADASLDLQAVLTRVYDDFGYANVLYRNPPDPPLEEEDAAWARDLIAMTT